MRVLADTNILARLAQPTHRHHVIAREALERLRRESHELCIVPQIIYEFWVVGTRPVSSNGLGLTLSEMTAELTELKALFRLFRDERAIYPEWERLVSEHDVKGKNSHDARVVAAMCRHNLTHILTFNVSDFVRFKEISVINPAGPPL